LRLDPLGSTTHDPGRVLARRLAAGEIDVETHERLREKPETEC
jgi:hypothetical protein